MKKKMSKITLARLVLAGAVAGIALVSAVSPFFGIDASTPRDLTAAVGGGALSAFWLKFAHFV
ncbi:MAG: hypothetical protein ACRDAM_09270 [Casimicrobium sp.]